MLLTCVTATFNVISSGNRERLIRCIRSVASLKSSHEHLVYDGASSDGTVELLHELEKKTPGLKVFSEKDAGIYNALNKGVRNAQGEWLCVLGCDDYLGQPEELERILDRVDSRTELVATMVKRESSSGLSSFGPFVKNIFWGCPYCHQGVLMRTASVRELGGFDEQFRVSADYDLMLKFHVRGARIEYPEDWFSVYGSGGFSETGNAGDGESLKVAARHFRYNKSDVDLLDRKKTMTVRTCLRYAFHADRAIRTAAWYLLARRMVFFVPAGIRQRIFGSSFK